MTGTLVNVVAIVLGSTIGLFLHKKLPKNIIDAVFQVLGVFTLFLGMKMALEGQEILLIVLSLVFGAITGEGLKMDIYLEKSSEWFKNRFKFKNARITEGFITASLLYCIGARAILGSIEEGMGMEPNLLYTKSVMDGFSSVALAAGLGLGVMFSIIPLFIYQASITLLATFLGDFFPPHIITELTSVGGVLLIGLGFTILEIKKIKIFNLLPALIYIVILSYLFV